jgi:cytochrome c biogenesis factor
MDEPMSQGIMMQRYGKWMWLLFSRAVLAVIMSLILTGKKLPLPCAEVGGYTSNCGDNYFSNINWWFIAGIAFAALLITKISWAKEKFYLTAIVALLLAWALTQAPI